MPLKPLTAEEFARTRYIVSQIESDPDSSIIGRLLDEAERSRALLKRIEWKASGMDGSARCPACGGADPTNFRPFAAGHESDCKLAALLSVSREACAPARS